MTQPKVTAAEFSKSFKKFTETKVTNAIVQRQMRVVELLWEKILMKTPVDTSLARGNWQVSINERITADTDNLAEVERGDPPTGAELARINSVLARLEGLPLGQAVWISNNLYYVKFLEGGTSKMAPFAMVRLSVQEIRHLVDRSETRGFS